MTSTSDQLETGSFGGDYSSFDCAVNAHPVDDLFSAYRRSRFLYPQKASRLQPHWDQIRASWESARRGGELIQYVVTYGDVRSDAWATATSWRSTHQGWLMQHLVSTGGPVASRAVILAGLAVRIKDGWDHAHQNWHRPDNGFAATAFSGMLGHVPAGTAAVIPGAYMELPRAYLNDAHAGSRFLITPLDGGGCAELQDLARRCRGDVYVSAEELDRPDLLLDEVDQLYRLVGLRRYRRIWLASTRAGEAVAAVLAYRGPLGMNFSFLENRCDLLVSPDCPADDVTDVVAALLTRASHAYDGLPLSHLMVAGSGATENVVRRIGGHVVQPYTQSICLQAGLPAWFSYIDSLYARRGVSDVAH